MSNYRKEVIQIILGFFIFLFWTIAFFLILLLVLNLVNHLSLPLTLFLMVSRAINYALMGMSLLQLVYVLPLVISLQKKQEYGKVKGVIIGAVLFALLSGTCWLMLKSITN